MNNRPMHAARLYFRYMRIHFRGATQYRAWWINLIRVFILCMTDPLEIFVLFSRFGAVGDWGFGRIMMTYGWALAAFGVAELLARGFDVFPGMIRDGTFDRVLLRPRSTFLQAMTLRFEPNRAMRPLFGSILAFAGMAIEGVAVTPVTALMLTLSFVSGVIVYTGVFLMQAAIAFFTIGSVDFAYIFTNGSYQNAKVPPQYLPLWLRRIFTFVVPMLLFSYYPFAAAFGWGEPVWTGWLAFPTAAVFLGIAIILWEIGARHYKSTGS